jgi:hypothetical protein
MNFLKRIANSSYVTSHFRWPSARTLHIYWWIIALVGLFTTAVSSRDVYHHAVSTGLSHPGLVTLAVSFLAFLAWGFIGLMFLVVWGLYYRMGTDIAAGFRRFRAWAPGAWQSFCSGAAAVVRFVLSIPSLIGRFFRALGRAFLWLAGRPAWWRGLTRKQKVGVITGVAMAGVYAATLVLFYPVAHHISAHSPSWMMMSDAPLLQTLCIDMFLGSLIATFAVAILTTVFDIVAHWFSKH